MLVSAHAKNHWSCTEKNTGQRCSRILLETKYSFDFDILLCLVLKKYLHGFFAFIKK
ncbi:unnamed protein product [Amoebophrya sp. A25]|nr:unnamed protein product [Amoebophrya sp. A25]|eukprot:GSA25T00006165001.1